MGIGDLRAMREVLHLHEAAVDPRLLEFVLCSSSGPWPPLPAADAMSGFFEALVAIRRAVGLTGTTVRIDDRMFDDARVSLGLAQVHATLALAAAAGVNSASKDERQEWQYVAGVKL